PRRALDGLDSVLERCELGLQAEAAGLQCVDAGLDRAHQPFIAIDGGRPELPQRKVDLAAQALELRPCLLLQVRRRLCPHFHAPFTDEPTTSMWQCHGAVTAIWGL